VNSLPKTVTRQRRDCDLNEGPSALESSMLTTLRDFTITMHFNGGDNPQNCPFSWMDPSNMVPWAHHCPQPIRYLCQFNCLCRAHHCVQQTHTQTILHLYQEAASLQSMRAMQLQNTLIMFCVHITLHWYLLYAIVNRMHTSS